MSVKLYLPPGSYPWHLSFSPTSRLSPLTMKCFPQTRMWLTPPRQTFAVIFSFVWIVNLKLQPWSSSGPLHPALFIFSKHLMSPNLNLYKVSVLFLSFTDLTQCKKIEIAHLPYEYLLNKWVNLLSPNNVSLQLLKGASSPVPFCQEN